MLVVVALLAVGCGSSRRVVNVTKLGAAGDGKMLNTGAFQKALDSLEKDGGDVVVPAGNFVIGSIVMPSNTTLRIEKGATLIGSSNADDYPLIDVRWEGRWREGHRALIHAKDAEKIAIEGEGKIQGDMQLGDLRDPRGPCVFEPIECKNVRIEGISVNYRRMWAIHLTYCENVMARGLTIRSTRNNGDGIDVDSCKNVKIENCDIDTGDDAIALKSGRGMEAVRIARPTEDVTITNCTLGSSFAGLALGTEMSGGIRSVRFSNCTFTRGANSIFIKSRTGRGGFMEDIEGQDLTASGPKAFLRIDLTERGIQDSEPVQGDDAFPHVANIKITGAKVNTDVLIEAKSVAPEKPIEGLSISKITGTCKQAITLNNVQDVELKDIQVTGFTGPFITTENVTGPGIENIHSPHDTLGR
jgi:polygalacturonase